MLLAPVLWFIIGVMIGELRRRERDKARVQREERWRQEVRENE